MMKRANVGAMLFASTALSISGVSLAQAVPVAKDAASGAIGIADIVVTARRIEENVQTVPVAVTALSGDALTTAQVSDITDLQRTAPSLTVATGAPSASSFAFVAIRGQGSLNASVAVDPAVAIYIDGVYVPRPSQGQVELTDLDRAEILRGPQGTLFGRNSTGGALNLFTVDPQQEFSARIKAGYGNYNAFQGGAMVNVPLGDQLALRLNYDYKERDGYGRNVTLDRPVNDLKSHAVRGKLKWEAPDGNFSVVLAGDYNHQKDSGQLVTLAAANPLSPLGGIFPLDPNPADATPVGPSLAAIMNSFAHNKSNWYETNGTGYSANANVPLLLPYNDTKTYGFSATVKASVGSADIKSITAYRYSNARGFIDLDATPIPVLSTESGYLSKAFSQELQLSADLTDRFNIISGLYYSRETGVEFSDFQPFGLFKDMGPPPSVGYVGRNDADITNTTFGGYLQGYYNLTDKLRLAAGLRWTWDKRAVELHNLQVSGAPGNAVYFNSAAGGFRPNCTIVPDDGNPANCTQTNRVKFDYPAWTIGLDYQATDGLFLYAKSSRASHAGGWNLRIGAVPAFSPEELTDVEFGFKADMFDRRLRLNMAVFHSWLKDSQRVVSVGVGNPPISTSFISNAGDIQLDGVELETVLIPWRGMQVQGNLSYLSGKFDRGSFVDASGDRSNEPLIQVPQVQYSIGATQVVPTGIGEASFHLDYSYVSSQRFYTSQGNPANGGDVQNRLGKIPIYGLLSGRIALKFDNPGSELAVWGRNLTKKKYVTRAFPDLYTDLGIATEYVGEPRTYGLTLSYTFGGGGR
ncbi:TonB-dependent receptor [Sphingobium sp. TCM1]|uniref:TonB-dependent receptor n=1 Tax=Sphingobium sp. TCM1 TaxID=453246 RepID=UPI0007F4A862|nr:TonB-dependent receptor [Sphingobium sp. TCM1]OAN56220.1 hypothetical protein A7Q26_02080 [Sphingobium sp. TCM1]